MNDTTRADKTTLTCRIAEFLLFLVALVSFTYALVTAPGKGIDVTFLQIGAREWIDGVYEIGAGSISLHPPFILPLLAPIAVLSHNSLVVLWLTLNVAATALVLYFVDRLWAKRWPIDARICLPAFFLAWAPFRVTLRNGQLSLMVLALLLGALFARRRNRSFLAGALLGLSLCKYSLTFPFPLYFAWKREWKVVSTAILIPAALTELFAWRLGLSLIDVVRQYVDAARKAYVSGATIFEGASEIKPLLLGLSGGNETVTTTLVVAISLAALICMVLAFARARKFEIAHFSALALFALWSVYHKTYDSVLCLLPAVLLIDLLVQRRFVFFSRFWLAGLGLLIISIPGLLIDRLKIDPSVISSDPLLLLGVHVERLLMFGMFCSLIYLMWKTADVEDAGSSHCTTNSAVISSSSSGR
ncbi:MAG TPA: glycosyltransferase family 87 protein [Blastocatellia bacterium]